MVWGYANKRPETEKPEEAAQTQTVIQTAIQTQAVIQV